jgi:hypothetical protein
MKLQARLFEKKKGLVGGGIKRVSFLGGQYDKSTLLYMKGNYEIH